MKKIAVLVLVMMLAGNAWAYRPGGCPLAGCTITGTLNLTGAGTALSVTNNMSLGGTLTLGAGGSVTGTSGNPLIIASPSSTNTVQFKNGPNGSLMLLVGGSNKDLEPQTNITLPGGTWGSGTLVNNSGPIFQNATFSGTTASAQAALGMFLQQTDNSSCRDNTSPCAGISENVIMGASADHARIGGQFQVNVPVVTTNTGNPQYIGLEGDCNLSASDAASNATCFGLNVVAHLSAGVGAWQLVGEEIDTWMASNATATDRIGLQIVDVVGSSYGGHATRDDVALSLNNQYTQSASLGYKVGLEFGRRGGGFPVETDGTLIYGQELGATAFTVANGIDWHLGTATSYWLKFGSVYTLDGSGNVAANTTGVAKLGLAPGAAPGAGRVQIFAVAGTNAGTCKIQALAGTSTTPVTVLDNIGSGC